jgi:hypothetical protein
MFWPYVIFCKLGLSSHLDVSIECNRNPNIPTVSLCNLTNEVLKFEAEIICICGNQ